MAPDRARREALALADPLPDPRVRRPPGRGAVEGQPAEGPVHRRGPARPRGPADGRAVHRARPGQPRPPARGVHGAARPGPDADLLDPPDGGRRGDVRVGRDRRPRPAGRRRPACATSSAPAAGGRSGSPSTASSAPTWLAELPGRRGRPAGRTAAFELELLPGADPAAILAAVLGARASVTRFEVVEPSLEALFIEHVGRPADDDATLAPEVATASLSTERRGLMARRDPLLPNAGIVARREYRDRTRSPLFLGLDGRPGGPGDARRGRADRASATWIGRRSPGSPSCRRDAELAAASRRRRRQPPQHAARRRRRSGDWERPYRGRGRRTTRPRPSARWRPASSAGSSSSSGCRAARSTSRSGPSRGRTAPRSQILERRRVRHRRPRLERPAPSRTQTGAVPCRRPSRSSRSTSPTDGGSAARRAAGGQPRRSSGSCSSSCCSSRS